MINDFHVTWFDCGGTTGWSHFCLSCEAFSRPEHKILPNIRWWDCGEFTGLETAILKSAVGWIDEVLALNGASFLSYHIGGEDFDKTNTPGSKENLFSPVRQNAVLDWECDKRGIKYQYQNRQLRTGVTKARLTRFGFEGRWTTSGKGKDKFAAMQHGVTYLRRLKRDSLSHPWKLNSPDVHGAYWDCACKEGNKCDLVH